MVKANENILETLKLLVKNNVIIFYETIALLRFLILNILVKYKKQSLKVISIQHNLLNLEQYYLVKYKCDLSYNYLFFFISVN